MKKSDDSQAMSEAKKCPQCGKAVPKGAPEGLCPGCLLVPGNGLDSSSQPNAAPFTPPNASELAKLFPSLEIIGLLGKGGMGAVYKARQPALDRFVALKILPPQTGKDARFGERFSREAKTLARLNNPNIVAVHEFGQVNDLPFFIMEFVDGTNLRQLQKAGRLSPREALQIVPQICDALQYAHDEGVVHRDIKPENVLIDRKGKVKIADFGLAKMLDADVEAYRLTGAGQVMGTPHYMAPEQVEHPSEVDHRADIFSLGVVFYELLTGELPLGKFSPPSRKLQLDVRLDDVVLKALEKAPEQRYQKVSQVREDVERITINEQSTSTRRQIAFKDILPWTLIGFSLIAVFFVFLSIPKSPISKTSEELRAKTIADDTNTTDDQGKTYRSALAQARGAAQSLQFRRILDKDETNDFDILPDPKVTNIFHRVDKRVLLDGTKIARAKLSADPISKQPELWVEFTKPGAQRFAKLIQDNFQRELAIVYDNHIISAPHIACQITNGQAPINGLSEPEFADLAWNLNMASPELSLPMLVENFDVSLITHAMPKYAINLDNHLVERLPVEFWNDWSVSRQKRWHEESGGGVYMYYNPKEFELDIYGPGATYMSLPDSSWENPPTRAYLNQQLSLVRAKEDKITEGRLIIRDAKLTEKKPVLVAFRTVKGSIGLLRIEECKITEGNAQFKNPALARAERIETFRIRGKLFEVTQPAKAEAQHR